MMLHIIGLLLCLFVLGLCLFGVKPGIEIMAMTLGYSTPNWVTNTLTAIVSLLVLLWGFRDFRRMFPTNPN
ncbi:MAG: hypothetical protein WAT81_03350 [Candidatus Moraniibacteriota bacterium]